MHTQYHAMRKHVYFSMFFAIFFPSISIGMQEPSNDRINNSSNALIEALARSTQKIKTIQAKLENKNTIITAPKLLEQIYQLSTITHTQTIKIDNNNNNPFISLLNNSIQQHIFAPPIFQAGKIADKLIPGSGQQVENSLQATAYAYTGPALSALSGLLMQNPLISLGVVTCGTTLFALPTIYKSIKSMITHYQIKKIFNNIEYNNNFFKEYKEKITQEFLDFDNHATVDERFTTLSQSLKNTFKLLQKGFLLQYTFNNNTYKKIPQTFSDFNLDDIIIMHNPQTSCYTQSSFEQILKNILHLPHANNIELAHMQKKLTTLLETVLSIENLETTIQETIKKNNISYNSVSILASIDGINNNLESISTINIRIPIKNIICNHHVNFKKIMEQLSLQNHENIMPAHAIRIHDQHEHQINLIKNNENNNIFKKEITQFAQTSLKNMILERWYDNSSCMRLLNSIEHNLERIQKKLSNTQCYCSQENIVKIESLITALEHTTENKTHFEEYLFNIENILNESFLDTIKSKIIQTFAKLSTTQNTTIQNISSNLLINNLVALCGIGTQYQFNILKALRNCSNQTYKQMLFVLASTCLAISFGYMLNNHCNQSIFDSLCIENLNITDSFKEAKNNIIQIIYENNNHGGEDSFDSILNILCKNNAFLQLKQNIDKSEMHYSENDECFSTISEEHLTKYEQFFVSFLYNIMKKIKKNEMSYQKLIEAKADLMQHNENTQNTKHEKNKLVHAFKLWKKSHEKIKDDLKKSLKFYNLDHKAIFQKFIILGYHKKFDDIAYNIAQLFKDHHANNNNINLEKIPEKIVYQGFNPYSGIFFSR